MSTKGKAYPYQLLEHREIMGVQDLMEESATQNYPLGSRLALNDGRVFRYSKAGAVALGVATIAASPILATERTDNLSVAAVVNAKQVTITAVATMTDDEYADGFLHVVNDTGQGLQYKIAGNEAITAGDDGIVYLHDPIKVALDITTDIIMTTSLYTGLIVPPGDNIIYGVGVPTIPVTALYYFWAQTKGIGMVLAGDSTGAGNTERQVWMSNAGASLSTAGGVAGTQLIGNMLFDSTDQVDTEYWPIVLDIE
jgi:hypothetical protein